MPLSATQSRIRARSSSSRRKRRRTGSRSARSSTSEAVRRRPARSMSWATTPSTGLVWRSERSARRTRRSVGRSASGSGSIVLDHVAGAEGGLDQRRERLDVRAHHDHVARLQRVVLVEQVEDRVAQHLDLAGAAVAGVDLDAAVGGVELARLRAAVGAHVGLDAREQGVGAGLDGVVVGDVVVRAEHELHLARVLAPGGEQAVVGERGGVVVGAADDRLALADLVPQRRRGVEEEDVHLATGGERAQDVEVTGRAGGSGRRARGARADRRARGRLAAARTPARAARPGSARRAARAAGARAPPARRPRRQVDLAARPAAHHRRPVQRVAVEQLGEVADGREAARAPVGVVLGAEVDREAAQPRLVQALADDVEQRPDGAGGRPRIGLGIDARGSRDGVADEPVRERERRRSRTRRRSGRASPRGSRTAAASASAPSRGSARR